MKTYDTEWGSVGDGWRHLVEPIIDLCKANNVKIDQIKEKYGRLTIYVSWGRVSYDNDIVDMIDAAIIEAGRKSKTTCEECGSEGRIQYVEGWYKATCDDDFAHWVREIQASADDRA